MPGQSFLTPGRILCLFTGFRTNKNDRLLQILHRVHPTVFLIDPDRHLPLLVGLQNLRQTLPDVMFIAVNEFLIIQPFIGKGRVTVRLDTLRHRLRLGLRRVILPRHDDQDRDRQPDHDRYHGEKDTG